MHFTAFKDGDVLAKWLAGQVSKILRRAIAQKGRASLAVSGGSTPSRFLKALSREKLHWEKVSITLADERWVPPDSARSNQRLVTLELLQNEAASAQFIPLYRRDCAPNNLGPVRSELNQALPLDVIILGMGTDGHTASLFPNGNNLGRATNLSEKETVLPMEAENLDEPRVTLTLPVITAAGKIFLHIEGDKKRDVLEEETGTGDPAHLPIRYVLNQRSDTRVVWAP